jgi:hypothetical protein
MPSPQRLEFVARHYGDLQTIRFAPVPIAMVLSPAAYWIPPHITRSAAWAMLLVLLSFVSSVAGFYWWSTAAITRRYGSVKASRQEALRMRRNPIIFALEMILVAALTYFYFFAPHTYFWEVNTAFTILILMLRTILDSTNPASRRIAWAIGLVVLFTAGAFLSRIERGAAIFSLVGAVWLSLSIFDFLLLRRTFSGISASPPTAATEAVVSRG